MSHVHAILSPLTQVSEMRFMLLHDNIKATDDAMKMFFMEVYELFIKVFHDNTYACSYLQLSICTT